MPTLGIEMTDREPINGWESIILERRHSAAMQAYLEARHEADNKWRWFLDMAETWISARDYESLDAAREEAEAADAAAHKLYLQANCPHNHRAVAGGEITAYDGEATDSSYEYCLDCGARL